MFTFNLIMGLLRAIVDCAQQTKKIISRLCAGEKPLRSLQIALFSDSGGVEKGYGYCPSADFCAAAASFSAASRSPPLM